MIKLLSSMVNKKRNRIFPSLYAVKHGENHLFVTRKVSRTEIFESPKLSKDAGKSSVV